MKTPRMRHFTERIDRVMTAVHVLHHWDNDGPLPTAFILVAPAELDNGEWVIRARQKLKEVEETLIRAYGRGWLQRWRDDMRHYGHALA